MRLRQATIEGYRSIRERLKLPIDENVTVFLGANDHGKSNILEAILHLNADHSFGQNDLNWDCLDGAETLPFVEFEFQLDSDDRNWLLNRAHELQDPADLSVPSAAPTVAGEASLPTPTEGAEPVPRDNKQSEKRAPELHLADIPAKLVLRRRGVSGKRVYLPVPAIPADAMSEFISQFVPRVELIRPFDAIPDATTFEQIDTDAFEFMRGIFYYAGLPKEG